MSRPLFDSIYLEPEQQELLGWMVEVERSVPNEGRDPFYLVETQMDSFLAHRSQTGAPHRVKRADLDTLWERGLLRGHLTSDGNPYFDITPEGRRYYEEMRRRAGESVEVIEEHVRRFLDGASIRDSYPRSSARWRQASEKLWGAESERQLTDIGHVCRETMQEFATELVERYHPQLASDDPTKTVERVRAVVRERVTGSTVSSFLDALIAYWGTVNDLVQRQEHGGQKEGKALTWEDARRVVFQTAMVMFEVARATDG